MEFEKIVCQQQATASYILRFLTNLKKLGQEKLTRDLYESRLELLESYWNKFQRQEDEIIRHDRFPRSDYLADDLQSRVEEAYLEAKSHMREQLRRLTPTASELPSTPKATSSKLPKLALPTFAGEYLQWETFRDLFNSVVHNAADLSNAARLQYLKSLLTGEAAALLANIAITDSNYDGAWKALQDRYGNERILLSHHLNRLLRLKSMTSETATQLKTLLDGTNETRRALENLGRPVEHWDDWFVHTVVQKLTYDLRKGWENLLGSSRRIPTYKELCEYLTGRLRALEAIAEPTRPDGDPRRRNPGFSTIRMHSTQVQRPTPEKCPLCHKRHYLGHCPDFQRKNPQQRRDIVTRFRLCFNCLKSHAVQSCKSVHRCFTCKATHHTLLHLEKATQPPEVPSQVSSAHAQTAKPQSPLRRPTLLATAAVTVTASSGRSTTARALLDQGSEASFISEDLVQRLRLPRRRVHVPVVGMGTATCGTAKAMVNFQLSSALEKSGATPIRASALVLPNLVKTFRPRPISLRSWPQLESLHLADPDSSASSRIDIVIGADLYGQTLLDGLIKGPPGMPVAQNTIFGWVLSGRVNTPGPNSPAVSTFHCSVDGELLETLRKFWEIEEINQPKMLTPDEQYCEDQFQQTHTRTPEGRFVVRLPRRPDVPLGDSRRMALQSFQRSEVRRQKDPDLDSHYKDFMKEYLQLGHMTAVLPATTYSGPSCYLPHHAVWKFEGSHRKIRVVFNASARTSSGNSLNDVLLPGPKLQQDLSHILLRWRTFPIAFSADIVKMFRQIQVDPKDQPLQRILWRNSPTEELQEFQLQTVTYGTSCAPFLAMRALLQLASEGAQHSPGASASLRHQTYVDDILTGADTLEEAFNLKGQVEGLLMAGGFRLAKWASNSKELAPHSGETHILSDGSVKTLGLHWNPTRDAFGFQVQLDQPKTPTKRTILSSISRLFDPLGWLAPVLVTAKLFLQELWSVKVDWDETLPPELEASWTKYYTGLQDLQDIQIPRWVNFRTGSSYELHGYCDASQRAYSAAVYLRIQTTDGACNTHLLVAKTKVAPLKVVSLPRLELAGAVLLVRLLSNTCEALQLPTPPPIHVWTDSQVVLHWVNAVPARWKCFVANRVSEIHQTLPQAVWRHVNSKDNPADCASRGIPASALGIDSLWWNGPPWLSQPADTWPKSSVNPFCPAALQEENPRLHALHTTLPEPWDLLERYSSLTKLLRVTAWILRFAANARNTKQNRRREPLSVEELAKSRNYWIQSVQRQHFFEDIRHLEAHKPIPSQSSLLSLNPILDPTGLLRVGGRLEHASLSYEEKHPLILPPQSTLSKLLVRDYHQRALHGGPQLTLSKLCRHYWIIGGRSLVRKVIHECVICVRYSRIQQKAPLMGQLPASRVTPTRAFLHCGLDYAGPIHLRQHRGRGRITYKGYIALFVCLATKAVHLEAVTDCSTAAFLAAFKRFVSRRGIPLALYSDQATNFKGADAEIRNLLARASTENTKLVDRLTTDGIQWHFNPPHSPHFGGLWEAGIKSVKGHLRRVVGDTRLTFEELSTVLAEIEACLNSRPLYPLSSSPRDLVPLTPGHFLIGSPPKTMPEPSLSSIPLNRLSRWQLIRRLSEDFWRRWSEEYLHHLQQRHKWRSSTPNLQVDDLVLLREDGLPPAKWSLGRVTQLHPGSDGIVRAVTLRTSTSELRRPVVKLCPLPKE